MNNLSTVKVIVIFILMQIVFLLSYLLTTIIVPVNYELLKQTLVSILRIPITFFSLWGIINLFFKEKLSTYYIKKPTGTVNFKYFIWGIMLPAVIILIYVISGNMNFSFFVLESSQTYLFYVFSTVAGALAAGIIEEIMFRGFLLKLFKISLGKWKSVIITSLLFGLIHIIFYPDRPKSLVSFLLVIVSMSLIGVFAAVLVLKTENIWSAIMIHLGWNLFFSGKIINFFNDKETIESGIVNFKLTNKSLWLVSGPMGIETSLIAIIVLLGAILFYLLDWKKA